MLLSFANYWDRRRARLAEFAAETCLSEGDLLRLSEDMVDRRQGVIIPEGGRKKTGADQISPLTMTARRILDEIKAERRSSAMVPNVAGLIFTRDDGSKITKGMIDYQVERAIGLTKVKKFVFHNYRNTALTEWARRGIDVDHAMMASGHTSVQMHKHYVKLQAHDIANAFGTADRSEIVTEKVTENREASAR